MRNRILFEIVALTSIVFLVMSGGAMASGGGGGHGGDGGSGGNGGGGGSSTDLGDLIILYRDADGVPYTSPDTFVEDPETGYEVLGGRCWQPIAFPSDTCSLDCTGKDPCLVPVDQYSCAVEIEFAGCTREVDFGRTNEARSPDGVFQDALEDVVIKLSTADCVTIDPAGRLVATTVDSDETIVSSTIDSPLQNLAIYRQLMLTGSLGVQLPNDVSIFDMAARALGAAADKSGGMTVDQVAYLNQIMGLSDLTQNTVLGKICETYREEVQGEMKDVTKCFLNYGPDIQNLSVPSAGFTYSRLDNFGELPTPAYIPAAYPVDGWFEYLVQLSEEPLTFGIMRGPVLDAVFCYTDEGLPVLPDPSTGDCSGTNVIDIGFADGNIGGFAQAADDTRAVISFMHEYPVLADFATSLVCAASGDIHYDVSISDVSGLQVPKNIIDGSEGREFTVTVANAGPDVAAGSVVVTAEDAAGNPLVGSPWDFEFSDLAGGLSASFVKFFTVDLGMRTTITWTAIVNAQHDVNPGNNKVTELTSVKLTGSGHE